MSASSLFITCFLAALLELDITYAFQSLVSRPIVAGPLFGILLGDAMAGLQVGIFAELLSADISPLGGIIPPSGVVAVVLPLILYQQGIALPYGFFAGVLAALSYARLDAFLRKKRITWIIFMEQKIKQHPADMKRALFGLLAVSVCVSFVFILLAAWVFGQVFSWLIPHFSAKTQMAFHLAYTAVPWIGLAALIPMFRFKTR